MAAVGNYEIVTEVATITELSPVATVAVPDGKKALYGWYVSASGSISGVSKSYPSPDGSSWNVLVNFFGAGSRDITVGVICAEMGG